MNAALAEPRPAYARAYDSVTPQTGRLVSLDVFRGITVAAMILVNNPGSWSYVYPPLRHAEWNGWTPTDLIFPFFLFIVGVAITLSLGGKLARGESRIKMIPHIARRSATLFLLGLFLATFPFFHITTARIPGVLQRIAVCFFFSAIIFLFTSARAQAVISAALLAVYWVLMKMVPVPADYVEGVVARGGDLEKEANLAAYVDNTLLGGHLWRQTKTWDPEGILSTIPAIATVLLGILTGYWLSSRREPKQKVIGLVVGGVAGVALGQVMNVWFPINKNLWTSSYVVFTAGVALLLLAACYWLVDCKGYRKWAHPFAVYGLNAITVFVLSGVVARLLGLIKETQADGAQISLQSYYYNNFFASWAGPINGSLLFAIAFIAVMYIPVYFLYRHRIFIKV